MDGDRERWNEKWRTRAGELESPAAFVEEHAALLPSSGRALDVAGGAGRHAVWLARKGLDVTLIDVSDVGLARAERRATDLGVAKRIRFLLADLDEPPPLAPLFDVVVIYHYLNRARRDELVGLLVPHGLLIAAQPTVVNLQRHRSPRREFLVEEGELEAWARQLGLEVLVAREGWNAEGRHEAELIARRVPAVDPVEPPREDTATGPYR